MHSIDYQYIKNMDVIPEGVQGKDLLSIDNESFILLIQLNFVSQMSTDLFNGT